MKEGTERSIGKRDKDASPGKPRRNVLILVSIIIALIMLVFIFVFIRNAPTVTPLEDSSTPEITLKLVEGPIWDEDRYRFKVQAIFSGDPDPILAFSRNDVAWEAGKNHSLVFLLPGKSYLLTATATNSEGRAEASLELVAPNESGVVVNDPSDDEQEGEGEGSSGANEREEDEKDPPSTTASPTINSFIVEGVWEVGYVNDTNVTLLLKTQNAAEMRFRNDGGSWSGWESYNSSKSWEIPSGDGKKAVHVEVRNKAGAEQATAYVVLDTVKPKVLSFTISDGAPVAYSLDVTLNSQTEGADYMKFFLGNDNITEMEQYAPTLSWSFQEGTADGDKTIEAVFFDKAGNFTAAVYDSITLDVIAELKISLEYISTSASYPLNVSFISMLNGDSLHSGHINPLDSIYYFSDVSTIINVYTKSDVEITSKIYIKDNDTEYDDIYNYKPVNTNIYISHNLGSTDGNVIQFCYYVERLDISSP